jgi:hypothetical protein
MKKKIHILINEEARRLGLYYGFWNWFFLFKKDLQSINIEVDFFSSINQRFFEADHLFLNSRSLPQFNDHVDINYLKKISLKNKNLYWFDMRDSAGTTQFEVLPYVKKYIKKQFYKDKQIYLNPILGGRLYTDHYIKKYKIKDFKDYKQDLLNFKYIPKLTLGWNIGVAFFFDYIKFSRIEYLIEYLSFRYFNQRKYKMRLPFYQEWTEDEKKIDLISLMNHNFYRNSVGFQRLKLKEILKKTNYSNKIVEGRFSKKKYYQLLRNSKISVGAYGWGEVCYREFEAITCGAAFMTADMSNIETWPNIYHEGETYLPYDFDFKNLNENIEILLRNSSLRKKLVKNSRKILKDCHLLDGKNYFINKILEIIS